MDRYGHIFILKNAPYIYILTSVYTYIYLHLQISTKNWLCQNNLWVNLWVNRWVNRWDASESRHDTVSQEDSEDEALPIKGPPALPQGAAIRRFVDVCRMLQCIATRFYR